MTWFVSCLLIKSVSATPESVSDLNVMLPPLPQILPNLPALPIIDHIPLPLPDLLPLPLALSGSLEGILGDINYNDDDL
jgi:hypothetical protein